MMDSVGVSCRTIVPRVRMRLVDCFFTRVIRRGDVKEKYDKGEKEVIT